MVDKPNALQAAQPMNPRFESGTKVRTVEYKASVTAANSDDGDLFVLAGPLSFGDRVAAVRPNSAGTPALTSAADNDLGFWYKKEDDTFVELDKDVLWDGVTLASALTHPNLLTALNANLDESKNIGQLLDMGSDQEPSGGVYLVLQTNTANTATGPLLLRLAIDIDEATTNR